MKHENISKQSVQQGRRQRTRNQRKRDRARTACMMIFLVILSMMLCTVMVKAWAEHPAEQPVSYAEHMISIGGDSYGRS